VLLLAGIALAAVLVGLVVITVTKLVRADDGGAAPAASAPGGASTAGGAVVSIGPAPGLPVNAYVDGRRAALADATGTRLAVVSFPTYLQDAAARKLVASDRVDVIALLVAPSGGAPDVVAGSMERWAADVRKDAAAERAGIAELLPTVDDPVFAAFYRDELVRLDALAKATSADGAVVFAVAVRASASELRRLAQLDVRLVDVAASAKAAGGITYVGLRPEETVRTGTPDLRP
jgi:hypothetical protein